MCKLVNIRKRKRMKLCSGNRVVRRQIHFLDDKVIHYKSKNIIIKSDVKVLRLHDIR